MSQSDRPQQPIPDWLKRFRQRLAADGAERVELVETHISWLLLAGDLAYKLKKPVVLPFLDYGSAERRHFFCNEELRLNRRFAPALYLDVVAVEGSGEWAVRMRRFAEAGRLDHVCARGELSLGQLSELARVIVAFHESAASAPPTSRFGEPAQVRAQTLENFEELQRLLPGELPRLARLKAWTETEFERLRALLAARKGAGRIRECHGDLHLGNLVLIDGQVTPFDCIEFNEDFRWIDVASELAFTYVDLLDHRRPDLAAWLLNEWLACSGDYAAVPLMHFYTVYRALVRAKVAAIRRDAAEAGQYLALADALMSPPRPRLTITFGLSGAGKTTASSALLLADATAGTLRLRSDIERKRLYGVAADAPSHSALAGGIYGPEANRQTYARLAELAGDLLADGWSVIVDAAFLQRCQRDIFHALADRSAADFSILACSAPPEELRRRISSRCGDASEATLEVLARQLGEVEPLEAAEQAFVLAH